MTTCGSVARVGYLGVRMPVREERLSLRLKRNSCLPRYIHPVIHHRFQQRDSLFVPNRFRLTLGIAGDQRAVGAGGGFGVAKYGNPFVGLSTKLLKRQFEKTSRDKLRVCSRSLSVNASLIERCPPENLVSRGRPVVWF